MPARDLSIMWRALVFNWLIGNCDAHAKNFSLLYDVRSPTLAPLYDLVSTTVYPELTTRLAMSLDGARQIDDVDMDAWLSLASEVNFSMSFARTETGAMVERVREEARRLALAPAHDNETAALVHAGISARAIKLIQS